MKKQTIEYEGNKIVNEEELEKEYNEKYKRNYIDNIRALQSAEQTFSLLSNFQLQNIVTNFSYSVYGNKPEIADALINELQKRELNEELSTLKNYLYKIDYKKPWLIK